MIKFDLKDVVPLTRDIQLDYIMHTCLIYFIYINFLLT